MKCSLICCQNWHGERLSWPLLLCFSVAREKHLAYPEDDTPIPSTVPAKPTQPSTISHASSYFLKQQASFSANEDNTYWSNWKIRIMIGKPRFKALYVAYFIFASLLKKKKNHLSDEWPKSKIMQLSALSKISNWLGHSIWHICLEVGSKEH